MATQTINYTDKVFLNENSSIADINKIKDVDMNEIKTVVNNNASETDTNAQSITDLKGTTLYEDNTGTKNNIILSDSIANYNYIEVFVRNSGNDFLMPGQKFYTKKSSIASIQLNLSSTGNGAADVKGLRCIINGTNMDMSYFYKVTLQSGQTPSGGTGTNNELLIYKVLGYK